MAKTPNMGINTPSPLITEGPAWSAELNKAMEVVDNHDHNAKKGVKISPSGLNIDEDLSIKSNKTLDVKSVNLSDTIDKGDSVSFYQDGDDLYYKNLGGTEVQITSGSAILSSTDGVSRTYPTGTISSNTVIPDLTPSSNFEIDSTSGPISITLPTFADGKFLIFKDISGTSSTNNVTFTPASGTIDGASSYVMSHTNEEVRMISVGGDWQKEKIGKPTESGLFSNSSVTTSKINDQAVTPAKLAPKNYVISNTYNNASLTLSSGGTQTNSLVINKTSRPIVLNLDSSSIGLSGSSYYSHMEGLTVSLLKNGSEVASYVLKNQETVKILPSGVSVNTSSIINAGARVCNFGTSNGAYSDDGGFSWNYLSYNSSVASSGVGAVSYGGGYFMTHPYGSGGARYFSTLNTSFGTTGTQDVTTSSTTAACGYVNGLHYCLNQSIKFRGTSAGGMAASALLHYLGNIVTGANDNGIGLIFMANGEIRKTTDAWTWNVVGTVPGGVGSCGKFGNGRWVVMSTSGTSVAISDNNGDSWYTSSCPPGAWSSITHNGNMFVAFASSGTNRVIYSYDGINWSTKPFSPNLSIFQCFSIFGRVFGMAGSDLYLVPTVHYPNSSANSIKYVDYSNTTGNTTYSIVLKGSLPALAYVSNLKLIAYDL